MDRNRLTRIINGREIIRRLREVVKEEVYNGDYGKHLQSQLNGGVDVLKFENTFLMAKIEQSDKIVRILSFSENVRFSDEKNWFLLNMEPHKQMGDLRWVSTDMRFTWIREFLWMI